MLDRQRSRLARLIRDVAKEGGKKKVLRRLGAHEAIRPARTAIGDDGPVADSRIFAQVKRIHGILVLSDTARKAQKAQVRQRGRGYMAKL